jgi:hypothetical protein
MAVAKGGESVEDCGVGLLGFGGCSGVQYEGVEEESDFPEGFGGGLVGWVVSRVVDGGRGE